MSKTYLLDTHTVIWFLTANNYLSDKAKNIILDSGNPCYISIASIWEIGIKLGIGKLKLKSSLKSLHQLY